jgi:hypothetical protein
MVKGQAVCLLEVWVGVWTRFWRGVLYFAFFSVVVFDHFGEAFDAFFYLLF